MHMKEILCLVLMAFLATGVCIAEVPDLLGNWTGSTTGYAAKDGFYKLMENDSISLAIVEQKDRLFTGNITYMQNGNEMVEGFAGAIGLDNKTLYIAEFDKGYDLGTIISYDEIELMYLEDGENGTAAIDRLHRVSPISQNTTQENITQEAQEITMPPALSEG